MNLRQTAEVAALVSAHSAHLIESTHKLPDAALHRFWNQTKQRLHGWLGRLNRCQAELSCAALGERNAVWERAEPVLEEVFVSEILVRVWSAVLAAADSHRGTTHAGPIAASVMLGQSKARQLAMSLLVSCPPELLSRAARVDRLRRKAERWTDMLLGHLVAQYPVAESAFDERRARDFGSEQVSLGIAGPNNRAWDLILAGLRLAFPASKTLLAPDSDHNCEIVESVLATFPAGAFTLEGPFKSVLHGRISRSGLHAERAPKQPARQTAAKTPAGRNSIPTQTGPAICFADLLRRHRTKNGN